MKSKKPVVRPTFLVKFWCVNLMFNFVLEKVFESSFDIIICQFFSFLIQEKVCSTREQFFGKAVGQVAAISH